MRHAKNGAYVFFITLIISFMVLSSIFLLVLIFSKTDNASVKQEDIPYISDYSPSIDESLAILLLGCEEPQSLPDFSLLVYYDAPHGIVYSIALPSVAVSASSERTDTLQGHYDYAGLHGCMNGVKAMLGIELDRYARFQKAGISNMVDLLGGIPYTLPANITIGNEKLLQGEQLLDGRRVSSLVFAKDDHGSPNTALQSEMLAKLLEQSFDDTLVEKYDSLVSNIFLNCETNLNQYDFAKRQTGFLNKLRLDSLVIEEIIVKGEYNSDFTEFYVSEESIEEIKKLINTNSNIKQ